MHNGVKPLRRHVVGEQIFETVARDDAAAIVENSQPGIEIRVVAQHTFHKFAVEVIIQKECRIRLKENIGPVFLFGAAGALLNQTPGLKNSFLKLSVAMRPGNKAFGKGIDGL